MSAKDNTPENILLMIISSHKTLCLFNIEIAFITFILLINQSIWLGESVQLPKNLETYRFRTFNHVEHNPRNNIRPNLDWSFYSYNNRAQRKRAGISATIFTTTVPSYSNQLATTNPSSFSQITIDNTPYPLFGLFYDSSSGQYQNYISNNQLYQQKTLPSKTQSTTCGQQQIIGHREPRIVGGINAYEGEFPWAVSIQKHGNHHCGGVIVGKQWILTAAHCVRGQSAGNLIVRTGSNTLARSANSLTSHLERDYHVQQIIMHSDFSKYDNLTSSQIKSSPNTTNADIALLKLRSDIQWNDLVWPVCFPYREAGNFSGHDAVVIGWGKISEKSEDFSNELQKVKVTIIDNQQCQNWFKQAGREIPIDERIICAGFKNGGKDACHGDSGGPLLSRVDGQFIVVGVVSTGIGCARPLLPGLYSRVSSYMDWIQSYITAD